MTPEQEMEHGERMTEEQEAAAEYLGIKIPDIPHVLNYQLSAVVSDQVVEASERVSVPAGDFECWKITYKVVGPTGRGLGYPTRAEMIAAGVPPEMLGRMFNEVVPVTTEYVDYLSPEVGLVKREKMNFRGNRVEEVMVLTTLTK